MKKSPAERQALWRERTALKAEWFGDLNSIRQNIMIMHSGDYRCNSPERKKLWDFFMIYPHCWAMPADLTLEDGEWVVHAPENRMWEDGERALVKFAMPLISSLPFRIVGPDGRDQDAEDYEVEEIAENVALMKRLGIWEDVK